MGQGKKASNDTDLQIDVGIMKGQLSDLKKSNERIEGKLDSLSTVSQDDFKKFVTYVEENFVKKESLKGVRAVGYAVLTAIAVSSTIAVIKLLGAKI